jgi:hypothetical protein
MPPAHSVAVAWAMQVQEFSPSAPALSQARVQLVSLPDYFQSFALFSELEK